tara:strand:+ start:681 stop:935 length:255 start_codon:yes stop_codon:yes gene_type:complete
MKKLITPNKIKKLTEKALKDKPISMPRNGYVYLKSLEPGTMFKNESIKGVLLECNANAQVVIMESKTDNVGKLIIGAETEVIAI